MIELPEHQTVIVDKAEAKPNWVHIGFVVLGIGTLILVGWLATGIFADAWPEVPAGQKPNFTLDGMRNYFWSVGAVAAGLAGAWGLVLAAVRTVALDRQSKTAQRESKLNEKKHASEGFATAIEQLGSGNFAVRLGSVYALEALARSYHDLHGPIFETLCAYVRTERPVRKNDELIKQLNQFVGENQRKFIKEHLQTIDKPDVVIDAILSVIGRRDSKYEPAEFRLNLRNTDLRKANFTQGNYERTDFANCLLTGANMNDANFENADLWGAYLQNAYLFDTKLNNVNLAYAQCQFATLVRTELIGSDLTDAHFESARLLSANMTGAKLLSTVFNQARLTKSVLDEANLSGADFQDATLIGISVSPSTNVFGADFRTATRIPWRLKTIPTDAQEALWPEDDDDHAWDRGGDTNSGA